MKSTFYYYRISVLSAFFFSLYGQILFAQNMTQEQLQDLRKESVAAGEALERVARKVDDQNVRKDLGVVEGSLSRITEQLDKMIEQFKGSQQDPSDIYDGGKKYPAAAKVQIRNFDVPVNATVVHVPVSLDKPSPNTVIAHVRVYDGQGGRADPDTTKCVIFRPGDPLTKSVSFRVRNMSAGNNLRAVQPDVPDGGIRAGGGILITARAGAVNETIEGGRDPLTFKPAGTICYSETGQAIKFDDKGGPGSFSTSLSHGRTQVGNGETGYYGTVDMGGFTRSPEGLVLSSRRLDTPVKVGSPATEYPFLATMLSGHRTPETQFVYGSIEWDVKMPNRFGSWPALWMVSTGGWPPEIDVYEGFGYNGSWKFSESLSTNLHGGDNQRRTFTRPAMGMTMKTFGLPCTLDSEFHRFAVTVDPEWITMFVDGVETMCYANPFKGEKWYPLTNVAVKAKVESPYNDGNGDMTIRSIKIWKVE